MSPTMSVREKARIRQRMTRLSNILFVIENITMILTFYRFSPFSNTWYSLPVSVCACLFSVIGVVVRVCFVTKKSRKKNRKITQPKLEIDQTDESGVSRFDMMVEYVSYVWLIQTDCISWVTVYFWFKTYQKSVVVWATRKKFIAMCFPVYNLSWWRIIKSRFVALVIFYSSLRMITHTYWSFVTIGQDWVSWPEQTLQSHSFHMQFTDGLIYRLSACLRAKDRLAGLGAREHIKVISYISWINNISNSDEVLGPTCTLWSLTK